MDILKQCQYLLYLLTEKIKINKKELLSTKFERTNLKLKAQKNHGITSRDIQESHGQLQPISVNCLAVFSLFIE